MKRIIKNIFLAGLAMMSILGCEDPGKAIENLEFDRVFTPTDLTVRIRNKTTAEISWKLKSDASSYVVEFSEDSLQFASIVKTLTVTPDQVPVSVPLDGETGYSVRVKGVTENGPTESKWATAVFRTEAENILQTVAPDDIKATSVTLRWPAGSEVTNILLTPGNIAKTLTSQEIAAGNANVTGLTGETNYTAKLFKGTKQRGMATFTTLIDIGDATAVYPEDNLKDIIAAADPGEVLVLFPGIYEKFAGDITINKSITLKGLYPNNKPVVSARFVMNAGTTDFYLKDLELDGTYGKGIDTILAQVIQFNSGTYDLNSVKIEGCTIRDYNQALVYGGSAKLNLQSLIIDNCVMSNIVKDGGDFIDFRSGYVANLSITKSTFNRVAAFPRDFIRMDAASGISGTGKTANILIDHCTFYNVSNTRRILYVRFVNNASTVTNTIFAGDEGYTGYYSNQANTTNPVCSKNNYFNAPAFYTTSMKLDQSSDYTTLDPGFANAAAGNFKLSNQALIDNGIGDPRWLQ